MTSIPKVKLSDGKSIPIIGLGTWQAAPGEVAEAVNYAIASGYRHIDCAMLYENEGEIGCAINDAINKGKVTREDLFITSKCWNTHHRREKVVECCKKSLSDLGLEYVDLYLVHWPFAFKESEDLYPKDENEEYFTSDVDFMDTWKGMEDCLQLGLTKSIGLSNFNKDQIERVLNEGTIRPVNLQVECHLYFNQAELIDYCKNVGITVTAYRPLWSPVRTSSRPDDPVIFEEPVLRKIAEKHKKSLAQILIRYQVQRGVIVIPKSTNKERLAANIDVFNFELSPVDMNTLNSFEQLPRTLKFEKLIGHKYYPF